MGVWPRRRTLHQCTGFLGFYSIMDAIRKKMQSMKAETDDLYKKINEYETAAKEANGISDKYDAEIRDMGKKVAKMEEAEKEYKDKEEDVNAQARRVLLLEEEVRISIEKLATTILKLANMSKDADKVVKSAREWESKTLNNEVEIEELDKQMREARRIGHDNEMKYDNLARSLSMMEDELKRADERVKNAEARVVVIEDELAA